MRSRWCKSCGKAFRGKRRDPCPFCSVASQTDEDSDDDASDERPADSPLTNTLAPGGDFKLEDGQEVVGTPRGAPAIPHDEIECPRCAERIKARAKACRFCGCNPDEPDEDGQEEEEREEPRGRRRASSSDRHERVEVHHHYHHRGPSPVVAGLLAFLITGGGQLYMGRVARAACFFFGAALAHAVGYLASGNLAGGMALWSSVHLFGIVDALVCGPASAEPARGGRAPRGRRRR